MQLSYYCHYYRRYYHYYYLLGGRGDGGRGRGGGGRGGFGRGGGAVDVTRAKGKGSIVAPTGKRMSFSDE